MHRMVHVYPFSSSRSLGACRFRPLSRRHSTRDCSDDKQTSSYLYLISPGKSMEAIEEDHILHYCDHEPVVMGRTSPSVSFLKFTLSFLAHPPVPLVPSLVNSQIARLIWPGEHSTSLDLPLVSALILS